MVAKLLVAVDTVVFCFFLSSLWSNGYSPIDVIGLVASTVALTLLLTSEE